MPILHQLISIDVATLSADCRAAAHFAKCEKLRGDSRLVWPGLYYFFPTQELEGEPPEEILSLLQKRSLRHCYALLTANRGCVGPALARCFNTRLVLLGLETGAGEWDITEFKMLLGRTGPKGDLQFLSVNATA